MMEECIKANLRKVSEKDLVSIRLTSKLYILDGGMKISSMDLGGI